MQWPHTQWLLQRALCCRLHGATGHWLSGKRTTPGSGDKLLKLHTTFCTFNGKGFCVTGEKCFCFQYKVQCEQTLKCRWDLSLGQASGVSFCSPSMRNSKDLAKAVIQECSVIITVGLCYGPSVLKDCCLCCRHVGTSRTTGCARTRAQVLCATTPTFTNSCPILMESTASGPRVSKPVHVRSSEQDILFSVTISHNILWTTVNNSCFKNDFPKASVA